jgi:hypothetical protein
VLRVYRGLTRKPRLSGETPPALDFSLQASQTLSRIITARGLPDRRIVRQVISRQIQIIIAIGIRCRQVIRKGIIVRFSVNPRKKKA